MTVNDEDGGSHVDTFDVTVNLNSPPVAQDDDVSTTEDASLLIDVLADNGNGADSDPDGNLDASLTVNLTSPASGTLANHNDGTFTYDPNGEFEALDDGDSTTQTFDYQIEDTDGETDSATVTITINGSNDAPVAVSDSDNSTENAVVTTDVLSNDTDVDGDDNPSNFSLDSVSVSATSGLSSSSDPAGSVSIVANQVQFDPGTDFDELDAGDTATAIIDYVMSDDSGAPSSSTLVIFVVDGTNDGPQITALNSSHDASCSSSANGEVSVDGSFFAAMRNSRTRRINFLWRA